LSRKSSSKRSSRPRNRSNDIDLAAVASWIAGLAAILSAVGAVLISLRKKDRMDVEELAEYNRQLTTLLQAQGIKVPPLPGKHKE
jgi:hypothetical protein